MRLEYSIMPRKIGLILGVIALILAIQSLVSEYIIENILGSNYNNPVVQVIDLFSVNAEETIPTWYSTIILFIASVLLAVIAAGKRASQDRYARHWLGLAVLFLYLSVDEGAVIHDILAEPLQMAFNTTGFLAFGWQIVAAPLVVLFALLYLRFLFHLPARPRNLVIVAGVLYAGGALVVEGLSANQWALGGGVTFGYLAIATVEELSEMLGVVVFIYALLAYLVGMQSTVTFHSQTIAQETPAQPHTAVSTPLGSRLRPLLLVAILLAGLDATLLSWALAQNSPSAPIAPNALTSYETIINALATDEVLVTYAAGTFGVDNVASQQAAAAFLGLFEEVMVVTLPSAEASILVAGHALPFDQTALTEMLHANGMAQFIVFDTPAVRQIAGSP